VQPASSNITLRTRTSHRSPHRLPPRVKSSRSTTLHTFTISHLRACAIPTNLTRPLACGYTVPTASNTTRGRCASTCLQRDYDPPCDYNLQPTTRASSSEASATYPSPRAGRWSRSIILANLTRPLTRSGPGESALARLCLSAGVGLLLSSGWYSGLHRLCGEGGAAVKVGVLPTESGLLAIKPGWVGSFALSHREGVVFSK
jgi:hypothetical protein